MGKHKLLSLDTHKYKTTFTSTTKEEFRFSTEIPSQDAKVDLKPLIVAIIPIYCLSETINVLFFLFLSILN
jgi:hypothetical protein